MHSHVMHHRPLAVARHSRWSRLAGVLLIAATLSVAQAALPHAGAGGLLERFSPPSAQAFQGGWDRDHWWFKITRGEVLSGMTTGICWRFVPPIKRQQICTPISQSVRQALGGARGVWAEVYPPRWVWLGNGLGWWTAPYTRVGTW